MENMAACADEMALSLRRADAALSEVMHRLDSEFHHRFSNEVRISMLLE